METTKFNEVEAYKEARECTLETLPKFIDHIMNGFCHDYNSRVKAIAACGAAAMWASNKEKGADGGISGWQASSVMWGVMDAWGVFRSEVGRKITVYDDMLYPHHRLDFEKKIPRKIFATLQDKAKRLLQQGGGSSSVRAHWQSIVNGDVPFGYIIKD